MNPFIKLFIIFFLAVQIGILNAETITPVSDRDLNVNTILPADVAARTTLLMGELELIRQELGKPKHIYVTIEVINAAPREVYYQALTLFTKSNRLAFEQTRYTLQAPKLIVDALIQPYHVWLIVDQALQRVYAAKSALQIPEKTKEVEQTIETTPSDVYNIMVRANQLTNALLSQRFSPSDVFQKITRSIHSMEQILETFPNLESMPAAPAFMRKKTPYDVYEQLIEIMQLLGKITHLSGYQILEFKNGNNPIKSIEPSDVYDLSVLLLTDINYLHSLRKSANRPVKANYTNSRIPSHVYQHVMILKKQVEALLNAVKKDPSWLNHS